MWLKLTEMMKHTYRWIRYAQERRKVKSNIGVGRVQDQNLLNSYSASSKKLIVFLVPGLDWPTGKEKISGGTMSIVSLCEETGGMQQLHGSQTILCTLRGESRLVKHTLFANQTSVYRFEQLSFYFKSLQQVIIHVPEYLVSHFFKTLKPIDLKWLNQSGLVHINVLNQNIRLMPAPEILVCLRKIASTITITTAHQKYCTQAYRDYYGFPLHKFSVWISPENYTNKTWAEKENLMVVSPDQHPMKAKIIDQLLTIPNLTVQIIQNLTYEEYKALIARAKWSLTFGEGLDGYFIEPVFCGAIGFAVYNEDFFTNEFKAIKTVFLSFADLTANINSMIKLLDNPSDFFAHQILQFELLSRYYSKEVYRDNIRQFYEGDYTIS